MGPEELLEDDEMGSGGKLPGSFSGSVSVSESSDGISGKGLGVIKFSEL